MKKTTSMQGGCLCGGVRYRIAGPLRNVVNCHCRQCLKTHGHYAAYTSVASDDINITGSTLRWFDSTPGIAQRGYCSNCGSSLFWRPVDEGRISVAAGTLDQPTGLTSVLHIFVENKADYYEIEDGLEQKPGSMRG